MDGYYSRKYSKQYLQANLFAHSSYNHYCRRLSVDKRLPVQPTRQIASLLSDHDTVKRNKQKQNPIKFSSTRQLARRQQLTRAAVILKQLLLEKAPSSQIANSETIDYQQSHVLIYFCQLIQVFLRFLSLFVRNQATTSSETRGRVSRGETKYSVRHMSFFFPP